LTELKKEYTTTMMYHVQDAAEMYMVDHPTVVTYHHAMSYIRAWLRADVNWFPAQSWKQRLSKLFPRAFSKMKATEVKPRPCSLCTSVKKQLEKTTVRTGHGIGLAHPDT
jgi:hypothetical protein